MLGDFLSNDKKESIVELLYPNISVSQTHRIFSSMCELGIIEQRVQTQFSKPLVISEYFWCDAHVFG